MNEEPVSKPRHQSRVKAVACFSKYLSVGDMKNIQNYDRSLQDEKKESGFDRLQHDFSGILEHLAEQNMLNATH